MNLTLSVPAEVAKEMKHHPDVKWTEVARRALAEKAERMRKLDIMEKWLDKKPLSKEDEAWMDANGWHPVDERPYKPGFVKDVLKSRAERTARARKISDLFEKPRRKP